MPCFVYNEHVLHVDNFFGWAQVTKYGIFAYDNVTGMYGSHTVTQKLYLSTNDALIIASNYKGEFNINNVQRCLKNNH